MWGCSSVGRASDRHAAEAGSIPQCGKGFFSQSQLSVQTLLRCPYTPCAIACINICVHVKDPVLHVRVRWMHGNTKTPSMHSRFGSTTLSQLASPGESNPNFPWEEFYWDHTVVQSTYKVKIVTTNGDYHHPYSSLLLWPSRTQQHITEIDRSNRQKHSRRADRQKYLSMASQQP